LVSRYWGIIRIISRGNYYANVVSSTWERKELVTHVAISSFLPFFLLAFAMGGGGPIYSM